MVNTCQLHVIKKKDWLKNMDGYSTKSKTEPFKIQFFLQQQIFHY